MSQTYLLSDAMLALDKQIRDLKLSYVKEHGFYFDEVYKFGYSRTVIHIQYIRFVLFFESAPYYDRIIHLKIKSHPIDKIFIERENPTSVKNPLAMEELMEYITPDLAEVLYFNMDLWP